MSETTDRELLELAAKAAGINVKRSRLDDPVHSDFLIANSPRNADQTYGAWSPLTDDGDALRLAVALGLTVGPHLNATHAGVAPCPDDYEDGNFPIRIAQMHDDDPYAATRRAITRSAAEIGKAML